MSYFNFNVGDTNFIALVNANSYVYFVNEDWDLSMLIEHWNMEAKKGNILVFGMTYEGVESDWRIETSNNSINPEKYFRKAIGYIEIDNKELYFVEYTCLTMAAQFRDEVIPDKVCSKFKVELENGLYKVDIFQYYNADTDEHIGNDNVDIQFIFTKVKDREKLINNKGLYWFKEY